MASLAKIVSSGLDNLVNLRVDPAKCVKARSPLSKCSACLDICPVRGVQWKGKTVEITECIECGLCASACPTGGIVHKDFEPYNIIRRAESLLSASDEVYIYCSKQGNKNPKQGIEIPCLGFFTWESWLRIALNPKIQIQYSAEKCENCLVKGGKDRFVEALTQAETLTNKKVPIISSPDNASKTEDIELDNDRRRFLGSILKAFTSIPEKIISNVTRVEDSLGFELDNSEEKGRLSLADTKMNLGYKILLEAIEIEPKLEDKIRISLPHIKENCQFCGVCSTLCPQQALAQQESNNEYQITLKESRCSGCRLCEDICFYKAIELEPADLAMVKEEASIIAQGSEFICSGCGLPYRSAHEDTCSRCKTEG